MPPDDNEDVTPPVPDDEDGATEDEDNQQTEDVGAPFSPPGDINDEIPPEEAPIING